MTANGTVRVRSFDELPLGGIADSPGAPEPTPALSSSALLEQLVALQETTAACLIQLGEIRQQEPWIADLQRQNGELRERFHEREVLRPIWLMLIGILDRCRLQESTLTDQARAAGSRELATTLRRLAEARRADRVEIESALSNFGVIAFRHTGERFDARAQQCRRRLTCDEAELHERITHRVAPGYRRDEWIVRPELVDVLVCTPPSTKS